MIDYGALAGRAHGGRPTVSIGLSAEERVRIEAMMRPAKAEQRIVRRAQAMLMMADGVPAADIARLLGAHVRTVHRWRRRFDCERPGDKLADAPRTGRPPSLSDAIAARVEAEACRLPSDVGLPVTHWSASLLGEHVRAQGIAISDRSVGRILRDAELQPHRQQMYLTSHDDEFREKRDDVLRVYYETPKNEHIVCVDEKTGIQALERRYADIAMAPGQPVRREFEYVRHGTLCWMGALDVRRGKPFGFPSRSHDSDTFIELLDLIEAVYPPGRGHIIMDNLSAHDTPDVNEWFDEHPRWTRHFTPKHASWLNQIECWFSILSRHILARGSFTSTDDLAAKIDAYLAWYLATDRPFRWSYRPKSWSS